VTKYYRSRSVDNPVVYVQEEGQWRGYAPRGVLQRSTGPLPAVILARTVEITQDEAQGLLKTWLAEAERIKKEQAEAAQFDGSVPRDIRTAGVTARGIPAPGMVSQSAAKLEVARISSQDVELGAGVTLSSAGASSSPRRSSLSRSRRPGWLPYALVGGVAAIVVVVLVVLATIGGFGGGSGLGTNQAGAPGSGSQRASGAQAEIVATVGNRSITQEQLDQRVAGFEAQYADQIPDKESAPDQYKVFRQDVLEYMITYELASQKAEELSVSVTDQDVQTQIDLILNVSFGGDQARFDDGLEQLGMTMDQFKQSYRESMLFQKVYTEVTKGVTSVSDSDIQAYYDQHAGGIYAGKSLDEVREEIESTLLDIKQEEAWQEWIQKAREELKVTYAEGWVPTGSTETVLP
jgi:hypothetical protein